MVRAAAKMLDFMARTRGASASFALVRLVAPVPAAPQGIDQALELVGRLLQLLLGHDLHCSQMRYMVIQLRHRQRVRLLQLFDPLKPLLYVGFHTLHPDTIT